MLFTFLDKIYNQVVYEPELNLLYFLYQTTNESFGWSIILLAVIVNLLILPLFARSYINGQKSKILQPYIREIQEKYRENPQEMMKQVRAFNKKHGLSGGGNTILVLLIQLVFLSGLFILIRNVVDNGSVEGLYDFIFNRSTAEFSSEGELTAFGIPVNAPARNYLFFPLLTAFFSYLFGMYTTRWGHKPQLPDYIKEAKKPKKKKNENGEEEEPAFDPEMMQKNMEITSIYIMPVMLFIVQFTALPVGLAIYMTMTAFISLIRQIALNKYYRGHTEALIQKIVDSDPTGRDDNPDNNLENTANPANRAANQAVAAQTMNKPDVESAVDKVMNEGSEKNNKE